jgi:hypothetical protein
VEKGALNFHATITIPKGQFHPRFAHVSDLDTFTKNDRERQLINMFRTFLYPRWPYVLCANFPFELKYSNRGIDSRQGAKYAKFGGER